MFLLSSTILHSHSDIKVSLFIQHVCQTLCQPLGIQYGQPYQALAGSHRAYLLEDNTQVNQHQVVIFEKKEQGSDVTTAPRVGNTRWAGQGGQSKEVDNGAET